MPTYFCKDLLHLCMIFHTLAVQNDFWGGHGVTILSLCFALSRVKDWGCEQNCRTVIKLQTLALLVASECHGEP